MDQELKDSYISKISDATGNIMKFIFGKIEEEKNKIADLENPTELELENLFKFIDSVDTLFFTDLVGILESNGIPEEAFKNKAIRQWYLFCLKMGIGVRLTDLKSQIEKQKLTPIESQYQTIESGFRKMYNHLGEEKPQTKEAIIKEQDLFLNSL